MRIKIFFVRYFICNIDLNSLHARYCVKNLLAIFKLYFLNFVLFPIVACYLLPLLSLAIAERAVFSEWFESGPQLSLASYLGKYQLPVFSLVSLGQPVAQLHPKRGKDGDASV